MDKKIINEILEMYTEITKIKTICLESLHTLHSFVSGDLDYSILMEYADFDEIINFIDSKFKQAIGTFEEKYTFHTFYTRNFFAYNIIFLKNRNNTSLALVAGPILTSMPNSNSVDAILMSNGMSLYKKHEFIGMLNNLPMASNERIYQFGKLLQALTSKQIESWNTPRQEVHGKFNSQEEVLLKNMEATITTGKNSNELRSVYRFCENLIDSVVHGNKNGIIDIIDEYTKLLWDMQSSSDNNRSLKNVCIIICSLTCHYAIMTNVPYERMILDFSKSIVKLEKLSSTEDIIFLMEGTIKGFAYNVSAMSYTSYSLHINRVMQYIKIHYAEKITLKVLAEHVQINPVYLSSLIKKETNMSLSDHINIIRIEESKKLLIDTKKSIQEIAYEVGYNYQSHFNSIFLKLERITPMEYRQIKGNKNHVPQI